MKNSVITILISLFFDQIGLAQKIAGFDLDSEYQISEGQKIFVRVNEANIIISGESQDKVGVKIHKSQVAYSKATLAAYPGVEVTAHDGGLEITETGSRGKNKFKQVGYLPARYFIEITIPVAADIALEGSENQVDLKNLSGTVQVRMKKSKISLDQCANVQVETCQNQ